MQLLLTHKADANHCDKAGRTAIMLAGSKGYLGAVGKFYLRLNKKIPVFRVTPIYLNSLVKPRFLSRFSGRNIILCILKGKMPFNA